MPNSKKLLLYFLAINNFTLCLNTQAGSICLENNYKGNPIKVFVSDIAGLHEEGHKLELKNVLKLSDIPGLFLYSRGIGFSIRTTGFGSGASLGLGFSKFFDIDSSLKEIALEQASYPGLDATIVINTGSLFSTWDINVKWGVNESCAAMSPIYNP